MMQNKKNGKSKRISFTPDHTTVIQGLNGNPGEFANPHTLSYQKNHVSYGESEGGWLYE